MTKKDFRELVKKALQSERISQRKKKNSAVNERNQHKFVDNSTNQSDILFK